MGLDTKHAWAAGAILAAAMGCAGARQPTGFAAPITVEALGRINAIVITDLSGDGRPDIAALNGEPGRLLILLNRGEGRFVPASGGAIGVTPPSSGLVAGDFNEDGRQDLVVASHDSDAVEVLLGRGDGTLEPARSITLVSRQGGTPHVHDLDCGDFDGDGHLDVVLAQSEDNAIVLALGDGKGGLAPAGPPLAAGNHPYTVVAADLDGDGALDVATPNASSGDLTVALNDGRGRLSRVEGPAIALQPEPLGLEAGDLNGDGHVDLLGNSDVQHRELAVLLGDGTGRFTRHHEPLTAPARTYGQVIADVNGDGMADVVSPSIDRSSIFIWLARSPTRLRFEPIELRTPGTDSQVVALGDLNADGALDVVAGGWEKATLAILLATRATD